MQKSKSTITRGEKHNFKICRTQVPYFKRATKRGINESPINPVRGTCAESPPQPRECFGHLWRSKKKIKKNRYGIVLKKMKRDKKWPQN